MPPPPHGLEASCPWEGDGAPGEAASAEGSSGRGAVSHQRLRAGG